MQRVVWAVCLTLLAVGSVGMAATISVDDDGGADYTSIQEAIDNATSGDTIEVAAGTYREYVHVNKDGLTIEGAGIDQTVIDLDGLTPYWHYPGSSSYASRAGVLMSGYGSPDEIIEGVTFSGFTVMNAGLNPPGGGAYPEFYDGNADGRDDVRGIGVHNGKDVVIQNCKAVYNGYDGINVGKARNTSLKQSEAITIDACIASNNPNNGITIGSYKGAVTVTNNTCQNNGMPHPSDPSREYVGTGILVSGRSKTRLASGVISGNTVSGNGFIGINLKNYIDGMVIEDNTVTGHNSDEDGAGIFFYDWGNPEYCTNITVQSNLVTGNIRGIVAYYASNTLITGNTITTDSGSFDPGQAGIKLDHAESITVSGNFIGTTGDLEGNGIRLSGGSHDNTIAGNEIEGADFLAIYLSSPGDNNAFTGNAINGATLAAVGVREAGTGNTFSGTAVVDTPWFWYTDYSVETVVEEFASPGDTVFVDTGTYTERVDGSPGDDLVIAGAGAESVVWESPSNDWAFYSTLSGSTDTTEYEFSGITFAGADITGGRTKGGGILVNRANNGGELYLLVHDNRFTENSTAPGGWVSSLLLCHNRGVARDGTTGLGPVRIYDNVDETTGGVCMSNSRAFDIFSNTFDGGADALFIGYGCPENTTVGDHYIYLNDFTNQEGSEPSIYMGYWGSGSGMTFLPNIALLNTFEDSDNAIEYGMDSAISYPGDLFSLNSFENIDDLALEVAGAHAGAVEATFNWWGSDDGPTHAANPDGDGVGVSDNVIYSPWLGSDPDADPGTRGVQLLGPVHIVVDDVGPVPTEQTYDVPSGLGLPVSGSVSLPADYMNRAIGAANLIPTADTIEVRHGTYDASEPITDDVEIVSEVGSAAHTTLTGLVEIKASGVLLGRLRQGFSIRGPVSVGAGVDATTIHINWNDLYDILTNNGDGMLDATFNFWGEGSGTVGLVDIHPVLPETSDTIIGYMDDHNLSPTQAIDYSKLSGRMNGESALAVLGLMETFGFSMQEAIQIVREYGRQRIGIAIGRSRGDFEEFFLNLVGYGSDGGLGGGGGGAVGVSGLPLFMIGETIPLELQVLHPVTGEPTDDVAVNFSVVRTLDDGSPEIVAFGAMSYDADLGLYTFGFDSSGLEPGIYDVYIGVAGLGESHHMQIEVAAP